MIALQIFLAALTERQIDELIKHLGTFVAACGSLATTAGVVVLIWRQSRNKTDIAAKIDANTQLSATAFDTANGHNTKIVELREEVAAAVQEIRAAKGENTGRS
jgi:hypothetical protein